MQKLKENPFFWIVFAVGLLCSLFSVTRRFVAEEQDREVAFAINYEHVLLLARESGLSEDTWLQALSDAGVHYLVGNNQNFYRAKAVAEAHGMEMGRTSATARTGDAFLLPPLDLSMVSRNPVRGYDKPLGDDSVPTALIENWSRTGVDMRMYFNAQRWEGPMVRTLLLRVEYHQNYLASGEPSHTEDVIFSAVAERGIRLVVLTPLTPYAFDEGSVVTDPAEYGKLMDNLSARLAQRGITVGNSFSCLNAPVRSPLLLAACSLLPLAMAVLFLKQLIPLKKRAETILLALGVMVALAGSLISFKHLQYAVAFGTAVLAACWGALWLGLIGSDKETFWRRLRAPLPLRYLLALLGLLFCSLAGAFGICALLAERNYMLQILVFKGVKLAQIIPIGFSALVLFVVLFLRNEKEGRRRPPLILAVALFVVAGAALVVILLRSGDNMLPVADLEKQLRSWLELKLYARPRTKEFLLAFPALALYVTACEKRVPILALPLGVLSEVGAVSVINTFCHIFTPLRVSFIRTALGAGIGFVIGLIGMAVFALLLDLGQKAKKENKAEEA